MHVCIYIYIYVYISLSLYIYIYTYTHVYTNSHTVCCYVMFLSLLCMFIIVTTLGAFIH